MRDNLSNKENRMKAKIDHKEIQKIIDLMEEKNLAHFELEVEDLKIKISRNISQPKERPLQPDYHSLNVQEARENPPQEAQPEEKNNNLHYITSPIVGTFFSSPDPASSPFVQVGDEVKKNQVLCIIEAMKLMNEIESDVDGVLKEIYIENGKTIEYGQKLFAIQPAL